MKNKKFNIRATALFVYRPKNSFIGAGETTVSDPTTTTMTTTLTGRMLHR